MHALIEFAGSVSARMGSGAVGLSLRGEAADATAGGRALELLFSGSIQITPAMPPILHAVRVIELDADSSAAPPGKAAAALGERRFRLESSEGQYLVRAHSLQLHATTSSAFFSVLPPTRVAPARRWGWSLLLWLLRMPPVVRLITRRGP